VSVRIITGTDTGVGKTIATAALAVREVSRGRSVAVLKPGQTGTAAFEPGERSDADTVSELAGPEVTCVTLASYPDPLAPLTAARVSGRPAIQLADVLAAVAELADTHDEVLVEGAGGLLVQMGHGGWTIADLALKLGAPVIVVARAGLGTLNHTALTLEACAHRGIEASVVIGAWPTEPALVHRCNREDITGHVIGVLPEGAGSFPPDRFRAAAPVWFS